MIRDRIKRFDRVKASAIEPHPKNWRTHGDAQRTALRALLEEIGIADACIVRELGRGRFQLIDGHLRREELGDAKIPVLVLDVTAAEADKLLTTLDPLAAMAGTDKDKLRELAAGMKFKNANAAAALAGIVKRYTGDELAAKKKVSFDADASTKVPAVIVMCSDEFDQRDTLEKLQAEGYVAWSASVRPEKPVEVKSRANPPVRKKRPKK